MRCPAGAVALAALSSLALAGPALAATRVVYREPGQEATVTTARVVADVFVGSPVPPGQKIKISVNGARESVERVVDAAGEQPCQRVNVTVPLRHNGRYQAVIETQVPGEGSPPAPCDGPQAASRVFYLAAPPVRPAGVKAVLDARARAATVSWAANPEPDIVGYRVERARPNAGFEKMGETTQTSFPDPATAQGPGDYRYQVTALRRGRTEKDVVASAPSAPVVLRVPGPAPPGRVSGIGAAAGGGIAGIDLARFEAEFQKLLAGAGARAGGPEEEGFESGLPYAEREDEEELGADEAARNRRNTWAFVAGGFLVLAVLLHLRWLRAQVDRAV